MPSNQTYTLTLQSSEASTSLTLGSVDKSWDFYNMIFKDVICSYSKLTNVTLSLEWKTSVASSKGDLDVYIGDTKVGGTYHASDSYKPVTVTGLQNYFNTGDFEPTQPKGNIKLHFKANVARKYYYKNVKITYTFTTPVINLSVSASPTNGGTVSGGGTLDFPKEYNSTVSTTISATPNTGYEFDKWSDNRTSLSLKLAFNKDSLYSNVSNYSYVAYFNVLSYEIKTEVQGQGSVSGGGTYEYGSSVTLTATSADGYRFVKWSSDENTDNPRTITVTGNATYTAIFELDKIYVTFDSIFNFNKWKDAGIISGNTATISNITDTGFSITANDSDSYTNNSHLFTVAPNTDYILEYDAVGNGHEAYVFCDGKIVAGRFWNTTNGILRFTVPSDCTTIAIRCDSNVSGNTIDYSNIRIYPADYSYMSNSVTATNRSCVNSWSFPTPTRTGYVFLGWNTKPDGSGITYNSSSTFPTSDLVLYSQWEISKINKIYIGTSQPKSIYVGTSEVKAVYVGTTKVYG